MVKKSRKSRKKKKSRKYEVDYLITAEFLKERKGRSIKKKKIKLQQNKFPRSSFVSQARKVILPIVS